MTDTLEAVKIRLVIRAVTAFNSLQVHPGRETGQQTVQKIR